MLSNERMFVQGLFSILIFAFVPLAIKYTSATPLTICLFRLFVTVLALALLWRKKITFHKFFSKSGAKLWLIGFIFFIHWITYAYGVKIGGPSIGVLGLSTYGIQLILAGTLFLGHHITKKDIVCLVLSFIGIVMIIPSWNFHNEMTFGLILALLSATSFALIPVMHKKTSEFNQQTRIFSQFAGALVFFLFFIGETSWALRPIDWGAMIFLAVFGTLVAHSLWAKISSTVSPNITGLAYYTIAPITILFSALFLGDKLTVLQLAGAALVIVSAVANIIKV